MSDKRIYIGIDNGVSGSIGLIRQSATERHTEFFPVPTFSEQNYTKAKQNITRIDHKSLLERLRYVAGEIHIVMERPMVNPMRFRATTSALRALESTLCILEMLDLSFSYVDSKAWQKMLLPLGVKGTPELKKASIDIGCRLFPEHAEAIRKQKDADGILIAEYCRRTFE